jgi:putative addiction module component (TIGR02574 family)
MAKTRQPKRTDALAVAKKIQHVQDLWDAIAAEAGDVDLTPAQRKELDRRIRAHKANPDATLSWREVRKRMRAKR